MSDKSKSIYFTVFAVLYFVYTTFLAGHGVHWTNSTITFVIIILSGYYYIKDSNKGSKIKN